MNEGGMAAALCISILNGAIRRLQINWNPAHRSCWIRPCIRGCPQFGAFRAE